ncbi:bifunctional DNA primase/polymerase [Streptomyces sp. NRRL S-15]|uniref:bifunctional DNA primase/polymerase n=1 Tax=Streptomyces sp. NRRL S-15 TaxID=1463886 RepID=UPI003B637CC9
MTHLPPSTLLSAALQAAERGWHVFPLRPGDKRPALHGETACPRTGPCTTSHLKWEQRATTDPDRIRAAWSAGAWNVGIATGPSGLVVVDLDRPKPNSSADTPCGVTTFTALCERAGHPVPHTRTIRTASGGTHLYFSAPAAARLHNTAGTLAPSSTPGHGADTSSPPAAPSTATATRSTDPPSSTPCPRGSGNSSCPHTPRPPPSPGPPRCRCGPTDTPRPSSSASGRPSVGRPRDGATPSCWRPYGPWAGSWRGATFPATSSKRLFRQRARPWGSLRPSAAPPSPAPWTGPSATAGRDRRQHDHADRSPPEKPPQPAPAPPNQPRPQRL